MSSQNPQFLDPKFLPKFQFQLLDEQLIKCIRQLHIKTIQQDKKIKQHEKDIEDKIYTKTFIQSLKQIQMNIVIPEKLQALTSINNDKYNENKNKNNNNKNIKTVIQTPLQTQSLSLSTKFTQFSQILQYLFSKLSSLQTRLSTSQHQTSKIIKQKTSTLQDQFLNHIKQYKLSYNTMSKKIDNLSNQYQNKLKSMQTNTLWKINQCNKRLQDRPNVQMVRSNINELQIKMKNMIVKSGNSNGSANELQTTMKLEQEIFKLDKRLSFMNIELENQIKTVNEKIQQKYINLDKYSNDRIDFVKKFENINIWQNEQIRKVKNIECDVNQIKKYNVENDKNIDKHQQNLQKLNEAVKKFTKTDEFAKIMQKIDPHQLCKLSNITKQLQQNNLKTNQKLTKLQQYIDMIRSKTQFWTLANPSTDSNTTKNPLTSQQIIKLIKQQLSTSEFKPKITKIQHQLIDLISLKQTITDMVKKLGKINKDQDFNNIKYEIKGLQQYIKREVLILSNRINGLENILNNVINEKKRPKSAVTRDDGMMSSLSTKKLVPMSCLSCTKTPNMSQLVEKKTTTVFKSSRLLQR